MVAYSTWIWLIIIGGRRGFKEYHWFNKPVPPLCVSVTFCDSENKSYSQIKAPYRLQSINQHNQVSGQTTQHKSKSNLKGKIVMSLSAKKKKKKKCWNVIHRMFPKKKKLTVLYHTCYSLIQYPIYMSSKKKPFSHELDYLSIPPTVSGTSCRYVHRSKLNEYKKWHSNNKILTSWKDINIDSKIFMGDQLNFIFDIS